MLPSLQNAKLKKWHEKQQLAEVKKELDGEQFLRRRAQSRGGVDSAPGAVVPSHETTVGVGFLPQVEASCISAVPSSVASAVSGPTSRAPSMPNPERTESILARRLESLAHGYQTGPGRGSFSSRRLALRAGSVARLRPETRGWLHIDAYGQQLPDGLEGGAEQSASRWRYWATATYNLFAEPSSSRWAGAFSYFMFAVILLSTTTFVLDTLPGLSDSAHTAFAIVETVTVQIFTADFVIRLVTCPFSRLRFIIHPLSIVDIVSVVPWYVGLALQNDDINATSVFRVLRLMRVFRAFKLTGRYGKMGLVAGTLMESMDVLGLVLFFMVMLIILFSTLMYFIERGEWDDELAYYVRPLEAKMEVDAAGNPQPAPSPFDSIPAGFWWSIVSLMTVGYGDVVPVTAGGKVVACVAMVAGVLSLALPISVLGTNFTAAWLDAREAGRRRAVRPSPALSALEERLATHATNTEDLVKLYMLVEQQLDELRGKLHDKVKARKQEVMGDELHVLGSAALGPSFLSPDLEGSGTFFHPDALVQQQEGPFVSHDGPSNCQDGPFISKDGPFVSQEAVALRNGTTLRAASSLLSASSSKGPASYTYATLASSGNSVELSGGIPGPEGAPGVEVRAGSRVLGAGAGVSRGRSRRCSILELRQMMAEEIMQARRSQGAAGGLLPANSGTTPELEVLAAGLHAQLGKLQSSQNTEEVLQQVDRALSSFTAARASSTASVHWGDEQVLGGRGSRSSHFSGGGVSPLRPRGGSCTAFDSAQICTPKAGTPTAVASPATTAAAASIAESTSAVGVGRSSFETPVGVRGGGQRHETPTGSGPSWPAEPITSGPVAEGWHSHTRLKPGDASGHPADAGTGGVHGLWGCLTRLIPTQLGRGLLPGHTSSGHRSLSEGDEILAALRACDSCSGVRGPGAPRGPGHGAWWQGAPPGSHVTSVAAGGVPLGEGLSDESVWVPDEQLGGALLGNVMVGGGGGGGADSAWCPSTPSGHGKLAGSEGVVLGAEGAKGGDEGPNKGGGSPDAGGGKQLQLISKIAALMTHQLSSRYQKDVDEMAALERAMQQKIDFLNQLLEVTGLLRSQQFPEFVKELRFRYRQFEFIHQETVDLKSTLAEVEGEVGEVEAAMQDLEERFEFVVPTPAAQARLLARVRSSSPLRHAASCRRVPGGRAGKEMGSGTPCGLGSAEYRGFSSGSGGVGVTVGLQLGGEVGGGQEGKEWAGIGQGTGAPAAPGLERGSASEGQNSAGTRLLAQDAEGGMQWSGSGTGAACAAAGDSPTKPLSRGAAGAAGGFVTTLLRKLGSAASGRIHPVTGVQSGAANGNGSGSGSHVQEGEEGQGSARGFAARGAAFLLRNSTKKRGAHTALLDLADVLSQQLDKGAAQAALAAVADASARSTLLRHSSTLQGSRRWDTLVAGQVRAGERAGPQGAALTSPAMSGPVLAATANGMQRASTHEAADVGPLADSGTTKLMGAAVDGADGTGAPASCNVALPLVVQVQGYGSGGGAAPQPACDTEFVSARPRLSPLPAHMLAAAGVAGRGRLQPLIGAHTGAAPVASTPAAALTTLVHDADAGSGRNEGGREGGGENRLPGQPQAPA